MILQKAHHIPAEELLQFGVKTIGERLNLMG
jgi:hypothetical protein